MNVVYTPSSIILFTAAFLAVLTGVSLFRRWSFHRGLFDVPNDRSSHATPTPRGGGLVIVAVSLTCYLAIGYILGLPVSWGYFLGALMVATVSWLDDLYSLPFWSRLVVHIAAALVLIYDLGFWAKLFVPLITTNITLGNFFGPILTVIWVVWFLNAYNFMDGIDGIASSQAIVSGVAWAVLASLLDLPTTFLLAGVVASTNAGFLIHNWQPAKIFMGDVGSAFLGFTLASMPLLARGEAKVDVPVLPVAALLFVWFFVFDTVFTFLRRLLGRQRVWEAHRGHIYQKLVVEGKKHSLVTLIYSLGSATLSLSVLLAFSISGIYPFLAIFSFAFLTSLMVYVSLRKKD